MSSVGSVSQSPPAGGPPAAAPAGAGAAAPVATPFGAVLAKRRALPSGAPGTHPSPARGEAAPAPATAAAPPKAHGSLTTSAPRDLRRFDPHARDHHGRDRGAREEALEPHARHAAQLAAPPMLDAPPMHPIAAATTETAHRASLETILPQLVKQIGWSKENPRKGTVRMEFGAGVLAGGSMTIHADAGKVAVRLEVPAGENANEWRTRIHDALSRRGIHAPDVEVT